MFSNLKIMDFIMGAYLINKYLSKSCLLTNLNLINLTSIIIYPVKEMLSLFTLFKGIIQEDLILKKSLKIIIQLKKIKKHSFFYKIKAIFTQMKIEKLSNF